MTGISAGTTAGTSVDGAGPAPMDRPYIVGASFRTADARIRDRLFVEPPAQPEFLAACRDAGLTQLVSLSTCDRVELIGTSTDPERASGTAERRLRSRLEGMSVPESTFYRLYDVDANQLRISKAGPQHHLNWRRGRFRRRRRGKGRPGPARHDGPMPRLADRVGRDRRTDRRTVSACGDRGAGFNRSITPDRAGSSAARADLSGL